ncbi:MAG: hypothetical protein Q9178_000619 [Gyalolechia marmorata]
MSSFHRLLNLVFGLLTFITPIVNGNPQWDEKVDAPFAAAEANRNKSLSKNEDSMPASSDVTLMNENGFVVMTCNKTGFGPKPPDCLAASDQASIYGTLFRDERGWAYDLTLETCTVYTPTYDDISKSNVTWTEVIDGLKSTINICKTGDAVLGSAKIDGEDGKLMVTIQRPEEPRGHPKSFFTGSFWPATNGRNRLSKLPRT